MHRKFPSLRNPEKYGYLYESMSSFRNGRDPEVERDFRMFETCGDRMVQHSPDWPITREFAADYLASLAQVLLTDKELADSMAYMLQRTPDVDSIAFAASVKYKAPADDQKYHKPVYYSMEEKKISSSESKRHDKRYQQVERSDDGSAEAIYRMIKPEWASGLDRLQYAIGLYAWVQTQDKVWMTLPADFIRMFGDDGDAREKGRDVTRALEVCRDICRSYRLRDCAESELDNLKRRWTPAPAVDAEAAQ